MKTINSFSKGEIDRAGDVLKDPNETEEKKDQALDILNSYRSWHSYPINTFQATLRSRLRNVDSNAIISQRLKRVPSIIQKLRRFDGMKLSRMQDIGGLRAVVSNVDKIYKIHVIYKSTRFQHELINEKDYIDSPKDSGYRGIHLVYRYKNPQRPDYNGLMIEMQIRSKIQHAWATAVETMGTFLAHPLKSSEGPDEWLSFFTIASSAFAYMEKTKPVPRFAYLSERETYGQVIQQAKALRVVYRLNSYKIAINSINTDKRQGSYFLIVLNPIEKKVYIRTYAKNNLSKANEDYLDKEKEAEIKGHDQVVLVSATSIENLKKAYPNYFLDTNQFIKYLQEIEKKMLK